MRNVDKMAMFGAAALGLALLVQPSHGLAQSAPMAQPAPDATAPQPDASTAQPAPAQPGMSTAQVESAPAAEGMPGSAPMAGSSPQDQSMATPSGLVRMPDGSLSNGPVPDTKANRARFGGPMSNAGKKSAAAGN